MDLRTLEGLLRTLADPRTPSGHLLDTALVLADFLEENGQEEDAGWVRLIVLPENPWRPSTILLALGYAVCSLCNGKGEYDGTESLYRNLPVAPGWYVTPPFPCNRCQRKGIIEF